MKKSVIYLSAFVMFAAVIAMSVGFSAAWFANITESSSPIKIGSGEDTAFITINTATIAGDKMKPAVFVDGYTISKYYDPAKATQVLNSSFKYVEPVQSESGQPEPTPQDPADIVFKENAVKINYSTTFYFEGQPDAGLETKTLKITIEGVYDQNPMNTQIENSDIPLDVSNRGNDYIKHIGYELTCLEKAGTFSGVSSGIEVACPIGKDQNISLSCDFYYNKADEELPSILIDKPLFILLKIQAVTPGETSENK